MFSVDLMEVGSRWHQSILMEILSKIVILISVTLLMNSQLIFGTLQRRGGSYTVADIILVPAAPAITELKSLERGATVYTGCGYTYSTKEDRDRQCGSGGTSKWIDDSNVINKLARGATVYTGCGYTYSTKEDRDRQCGSGGTSKWIDDRKPAPAQAAPAQAAPAQAAPAQAAPAQAAPAQAAPAQAAQAASSTSAGQQTHRC